MPSLGWDSSNLHLLLSKVDSISLELTYVLHPNLGMSLHLCRKPLSLLQTSLSPSHETPWSLPAGIFFHTSRYFMVRPPDPMWVMWFRVQGPERLQAPLGAPTMRLGKPPTCWVLFTINDKIKVTKMLLSKASCEKDTSRCSAYSQLCKMTPRTISRFRLFHLFGCCHGHRRQIKNLLLVARASSGLLRVPLFLKT